MAMAAKIALVEVFHSIQGEGRNVGRNAVFVRLAGCNLSCKFAEDVYCDTPWTKAKHKWTIEKLFSVVDDMLTNSMSHLPTNYLQTMPEESPMLVITGGEPTMAPQFDLIVEWGLRRGLYIAVETNGTLWRDSLPACNWVTVSPHDNIEHGSPAHLPPKVEPKLHPRVVGLPPDEIRYVITQENEPMPNWYPAKYHYLSPGVMSDGSGEEWKFGFPGFFPGAVDRCMEILRVDPRWRLSIQTHKIIGAR